MSALPEASDARTSALDSARTGPLAELVALAPTLTVALWLGLRPFAEPDHWWHLRVGVHIRQTGELVFSPDPWASFADQDYVATQWLPEVVASWVFDRLGMGGLLWLRASLIILIALTVFRISRVAAGPAVSAVTTVLCLLGSSASLNPRPQLLSFLFFAITVGAWRAMATDRRPRWWLVPMFWLWACSHGLWTFGLLLSFLTLAAMVFDPRDRVSRASALRLGALVAACATATALTPLGPRLWLTPFDVASNAARVIQEWQRAPITSEAVIVAALMLLTTLALGARRPLPPLWKLAHFALAVIFLAWMWRLVPLATILAAPLLASTLHTRLRRPDAVRGVHALRRSRVVGGALALTAASVLALSPYGDAASRYPADLAAADSALTCRPDGDVVFASNGLSGWLLWRHPELSPVADLRVEIYAWEHVRRHRAAARAEPGWQEFVRETGASVALLLPDSELIEPLKRQDWTVVTDEPGGVLLARPGLQVEAGGGCR